MIRIVGVGPGTHEHITQEARRVLAGAEVVVGGARLLDTVETPPHVRRVELPAADMVDAVADVLQAESKTHGEVVLLVSGDPGFYSLAKRVIACLGREAVRVVPGISSLQIMAARICRSWVHVATATLHGREKPEIEQLVTMFRSAPALVILLGAANDAISHMNWLAASEPLRTAWSAVGWDLGLPHEQVFDAESLEALLRCPYRGRLALLWLERKDADR